jgi:hypothetical protein
MVIEDALSPALRGSRCQSSSVRKGMNGEMSRKPDSVELLSQVWLSEQEKKIREKKIMS